jgi:small subunit ribosomal protein S3
MGQKVNPIGFRVGIVRPWSAVWFSEKDYQRFLAEDIAIRNFIKKKYYHAGISSVIIERAANKAKVFVHAAKPGVILGRRAAGLDALRNDLQKLTSTEIFPNVIEVRKVETDALLVAENIAAQLVKRVSFRRAMKKAVTQVMRSGGKGVKVMCSGRLGGAEMSRTEWYREGRVPLHTLRADIDYGLAEAKTTYGVIGVKVWIFKGEILPGDADEPKNSPPAFAPSTDTPAS